MSLEGAAGCRIAGRNGAGRRQRDERNKDCKTPSHAPKIGGRPSIDAPQKGDFGSRYGLARARAAVSPRRSASQASRSTWIVPATGIAASAPRMPAIFAPINTAIRIASGES